MIKDQEILKSVFADFEQKKLHQKQNIHIYNIYQNK